MTLLALSCDTMEAYITLECNLNFDVSELNELDWIHRIVNEDPEYYQLLNLLGSTVVLYDPDLLIHPVKLFFHDRSWYYNGSRELKDLIGRSQIELILPTTIEASPNEGYSHLLVVSSFEWYLPSPDLSTTEVRFQSVTTFDKDYLISYEFSKKSSRKVIAKVYSDYDHEVLTQGLIYKYLFRQS